MEVDKKRIAELVVKVQNGNDTAFEELYNLTNRRAFFVALEFVKNDHDAEDILQESYIKALSKIGELDKPDSFQSWLNQIVANKSKDYLKKKKPTLFTKEENEAFEVVPDEDTEFNPEENVDKAELQKTVMEVLDELSEEKRACILMMYYEEMSVGQIAETLEIPEGTVKTRLFSARKDLKEKFASRGVTSAFSVAPVGVVIWAFKNASQAAYMSFVSGNASAGVLAAVTAAGGTATAVVSGSGTVSAVASGTGAKVAAFSTAQKVIAGISAAAVVAGTGAGTVAIVRNLNDPAAIVRRIEWTVATADMIELKNGMIVDFDEAFSGSIEIPEEIDGEEITHIGSEAFRDCELLEAVKIPSTVEDIDRGAFDGCDNLETVWMNTNSCNLWSDWFGQIYPFTNNEKLKYIAFGEEVTSIPANVCNGVSNLEAIVSFGEITRIGDGAFKDCVNLKEVDLSSVTQIEADAFYGCTSLENPEFSDELESIGGGAYGNCASIDEITIPPSVKSIGEGAFNGCEKLEKVYFNSNSCTLWPALLGNKYPFENNENLKTFVFGKGVTSIPANVCDGVTNLENVEFKDKVTKIGNGAFMGCVKLKKVDLSSVTEIGADAFNGCSLLENPKFSDKLESIGGGAYENCASIGEITIPPSVGSIGEGAFNGCEKLEKVYFNSNSCALWPALLGNKYPFENNENLKTFVFGKGVTSISANVCNGVTNLESVEFKDKITEIKSGAFEGCELLGKVHFAGSEDEWNEVEISGGNEALANAETITK